MIKYLEPGETIQFKLKKSITPIIFMIIAFPIWLYVSSIFLIPAVTYVMTGEGAAPASEYFIAGLAGLLVFIPVIIAIFLSYAFNQLIMTDRKVCIRKGLSGRTFIIRHSDIRSFQRVTAGKTQSTQRVDLYLLCGDIIKTGKLYTTFGSLQALLELLRSRYEGRGFTRQELLELKAQNPQAGSPVVKRNFLCPALLLLPFLLALIFSGVFLMR